MTGMTNLMTDAEPDSTHQWVFAWVEWWAIESVLVTAGKARKERHSKIPRA
jgi:hypothetical protein